MRPQKFRGNVFVANLPRGFTDAQLAQAFDKFGMVMGACLARDHATGATKGHGLVDLAPAAAAARAVEEMNGVEIGGRRIEARLADPNMALSIIVKPAPDERPPRAHGAHDHAPRAGGHGQYPRAHGGHDYPPRAQGGHDYPPRAADAYDHAPRTEGAREPAPRPAGTRPPVRVEIRRSRRPS